MVMSLIYLEVGNYIIEVGNYISISELGKFGF